MKRVAGLLLFGLLMAVGWSWASPVERWVDMARSAAWGQISVSRTVEFNFGEGELSSALTRWPNQFSLEFISPSNGKKVAWRGEKYQHPVLVDVVNGAAWLVINSSDVYGNVKKYGCPEIDYVFLTYDTKDEHWRPVAPRDAPQELQQANLSYGYAPHLLPADRVLEADVIAKAHQSSEFSTAGHFNRIIPRTFEQWQFRHKVSSSTRRNRQDCRPPLAQPTDFIAAAGPSSRVELELLGSEIITPAMLIEEKPNSDESLWSGYAWDKARVLACSDRLKQADPQDQRLVGWQRFTQDSSRQRVFPNSYSWFCDVDALWIVAPGMTEPGRLVITKATNTGDILYRASFAKPPLNGAQGGTVRFSTLRSAQGFVHFEWVGYDSGGYQWHVKHVRRFRFKEPNS